MSLPRLITASKAEKKIKSAKENLDNILAKDFNLDKFNSIPKEIAKLRKTKEIAKNCKEELGNFHTPVVQGLAYITPRIQKIFEFCATLKNYYTKEYFLKIEEEEIEHRINDVKENIAKIEKTLYKNNDNN